MTWFDILLLGGLIWLFSEVARLRARVSELERGQVSAPLVPANAETPMGPGAAGETGSDAVSSAHRRSRVRGNDDEAEEEGPSTWERLVGGRVLIWVGGVALALAGLFLVRYSIELGLIGPGVRMALAALLGAAVVGAGEWARTHVDDDPRVAQALVGAGVLILYAAAYGAYVLYGLLGAGTAFALMAAVAGAGLFLALRHGWPVAALGLVGALAAPALVADLGGGVLPLLGYLLLINGAVLSAARARSWGALLWPAVLGTAAWTVPLSVSAGGWEVLAVGGFVLGYALAATLVLVRGADDPRQPEAAWPAGLGLVQLALLTAAESFFIPGWLLYGALAGATFWLSRANRLPWAPAGAAAGACVLLGWRIAYAEPASPDPWPLAVGILLLFAPPSWWRAARGDERPVWILTLAIALLGPVLILRTGVPAELPRAGWGMLFLALSLPLVILWARLAGTRGDVRPAALSAAAATLAGLGAADLFEVLWLPAALALVGLVTASAAGRRGEAGSAHVAGVVGAVALLASWSWLAGRLSGAAPDWPGAGEATAALAVPGALLAGAAWATREAGVRRWLWLGAGAAGLAWGVVLARQLSGLARVLSFLALGLLLIVAGRLWSRRREGGPAREEMSREKLVGATGFEPATPTPPV